MNIIPRLILIVLMLSFCNAFAQAPSIEWQKTFGGSKDDFVNMVIEDKDGNYAVAATTSSTDGDISDNKSRLNCWIFLLDKKGNIQRNKCFGPETDHQPYSMIQSSDGSYVVAGYTMAADGNKTGNHGNDDFWITGFNPVSFKVNFARTCGGRTDDWARSIVQTTDGGFAVAGWGGMSGLNLKHALGGNDYWLVKLNTRGQLEWENSYGGSGMDNANAVVQTNDGGYVLAGTSSSNNLHVTGNHGSADCWLMKADASGVIVWQRSIGGSGLDYANNMDKTSDKGFIISGHTLSNDGDAKGNHGNFDGWVVKTDSIGNVQWYTCLGGTRRDELHEIHQTTDGGYIAVGTTNSNDGDVSGYHSGKGNYSVAGSSQDNNENNASMDIWVVKLNASGKPEWQKCIGGSKDDTAYSIKQTSDGGYIIGGFTGSSDGDVPSNHGQNDCFIIKLSK
jgi:hypothetical protein